MEITRHRTCPLCHSLIDRISIMDSMSPEDSATIERIWHCAEAFHFMLLAQRQLRFGIVHSAVITALRLREYEDVLIAEDIYSLLALASCADRSIFWYLLEGFYQAGVFG